MKQINLGKVICSVTRQSWLAILCAIVVGGAAYGLAEDPVRLVEANVSFRVELESVDPAERYLAESELANAVATYLQDKMTQWENAEQVYCSSRGREVKLQAVTPTEKSADEFRLEVWQNAETYLAVEAREAVLQEGAWETREVVTGSTRAKFAVTGALLGASTGLLILLSVEYLRSPSKGDK